MTRATRAALLFLPGLALVVAPSLAQNAAGEWTGSVEVGARGVSIDGNEDKFREDLNLREGIRLLDLDLSSRFADNGLLDQFDLLASGLGGDPYQTARLRLRKTGRYDLRATYRSSDYFYRDAGYFFSDSGDLHTWDARREFFNLDLRIEAADWVTVRVGADLLQRDGGSTTTRSLQRDVFSLERPVDQEASSYWVGADFRWSHYGLSVEQRFRSHENQWRMSSGVSDGVETGGAALDALVLDQVQDADTPITQVLFSGVPGERVRYRIGYTWSDTDLDFSENGAWQGTDFDALAFQTTVTNTGRGKRESQMLDGELIYGISDDVDLTASISHRTYEQDGSIDYVEMQTGGTDAGTIAVQGDLRNSLDLDTVALALDWAISPAWRVGGGVGFQQRDADFQLAGPAVETDRTLYRAAVGYRPDAKIDLRASYEMGSDDDPYTQVSPTDTDRLLFTARLRPARRLTVGLHLRDETRENLLTYPLGKPTDEVPPATGVSTATFGVTSWGATVGWASERLDVFGGYTRTEIDTNADIVFVTGFTFAPAFDFFTRLDQTRYVADQNLIHAGGRFRFGKAWQVAIDGSRTENEGSFPLEVQTWRGQVTYEFPVGVFVRVEYRSHDLDESNPFAGTVVTPTPNINDYTADLTTVAVGYRFRSREDTP